MARYNLAQALGPGAAALEPLIDSLACAAAAPRRVRTDNRLHAWEWLATPEGRLLKTDAVDHDDAHDLVGCQDIVWDIAGARVEFALDEGETGRLCETVAARAGAPVDAALLGLMDICYCAFQLGYWGLAHGAAEEHERPSIHAALMRYKRRLTTLTT
jgi:hypothetical protein